MKKILPNLILGTASAVALALFARWCWRDIGVEHEERHADYFNLNTRTGEARDPITNELIAIVDPTDFDYLGRRDTYRI